MILFRQNIKDSTAKLLKSLNLLQNGTLPEKISVILERTGFTGINLRGLAFRLGINAKKIREALENLFSGKKAFLLDSDDTTVISAYFSNQLEELIAKNLAAYHKKNPLQEGISKEELKASLGNFISPKLFNMAMSSLNKKGTIVSDKNNVRLSEHQVQLAGELDSLRQTIGKIYNEAGLTPPSLTDVVSKFKDQKAKAQSIINLMLKDGDLIKINEELCFAREALEKLRDDYKALLIKDGQATPASFKDLTGLSRKYIIPLMEYFDMNKLTVRVGDHRILREKT